MVHPTHFVFSPRVGFSGSVDQKALLSGGPNPRVSILLDHDVQTFSLQWIFHLVRFNSFTFIHFWHALLWVRSTRRRHHSPEWMILSHVNCFIQGEVQWFQVLLGSLHPCSTGASRWSPTILQEWSLRSAWHLIHLSGPNLMVSLLLEHGVKISSLQCIGHLFHFNSFSWYKIAIVATAANRWIWVCYSSIPKVRYSEPHCRLCIHIPHYPHPNPDPNPNPKPNRDPNSCRNSRPFE